MMHFLDIGKITFYEYQLMSWLMLSTEKHNLEKLMVYDLIFLPKLFARYVLLISSLFLASSIKCTLCISTHNISDNYIATLFDLASTILVFSPSLLTPLWLVINPIFFPLRRAKPSSSKQSTPSFTPDPAKLMVSELTTELAYKNINPKVMNFVKSRDTIFLVI